MARSIESTSKSSLRNPFELMHVVASVIGDACSESIDRERFLFWLWIIREGEYDAVKIIHFAFYKIALKPNVGLVIVGDMNRLRAQAADVR